MLRLGEKIVIVEDAFEQNLPVGEYGYIIAYDRNPDNAFDYVIRCPKAGRNFFVPASDIQSEDQLIKQEVDRVEREAMLDFALATHNEKLFFQIMNGDENPPEAKGEPTQEAMSQAEFIKQINLRAWI